MTAAASAPASRRVRTRATGLIRHVLTSEYPPQPGGVSDHTRELARALAREGEEVHVWTSGGKDVRDDGPGVTVHRCGRGFGRAVQGRIANGLDAFPGPRSVLVQWVAQGYGRRGANLGFARWLWDRRRRGDVVEPIVHEPFLPWQGGAVRRTLALAQRLMLRMLLDGAERVWTSTPSWIEYCRSWSTRETTEVQWLPVASNVPRADADRVSAIRGDSTAPVVGHFGTFAEGIAAAVARTFETLAERRRDVRFTLVGRGAEEFASGLPIDGSRLRVADGLPAEAAAAELAACDVLFQPFPEGITVRRTTVMAGLRNARPIVSTRGPLTEPVWEELRGARLVAADGHAVAVIDELLTDERDRELRSRAAEHEYEEHFAIRNAVTLLRRNRR